MTKFSSALAGAIIAIACTSLVELGSANAQTRTWLSSAGDDNSATCSFASPCQSLATAFNKAGVGGEINCKDNVAFSGSNSINHSVTINCEGAFGANASPTSAGTTGLLTITVGATDTVVLRGLNLDFLRLQGGIGFLGSGTLIVDRVFSTGGTSAGLIFRPNGPSKLVVSDSTFTANGNGSTGAGILIKPQSGGTAQIVLNRVNASENPFGVAVDGTTSTGGINMTITDSLFASNSNDGLVATTSSGTAPIGVYVKNTKSTYNQFGIRSLGPNVTVRVEGSTIVGNDNGLVFGSGGSLLSAGTNAVEANGNNGTFSGQISLK